jgi:hypothetical protein
MSERGGSCLTIRRTFGIASRLTAKLLVVNFEVRPCTAELASPAITLQNRAL